MNILVTRRLPSSVIAKLKAAADVDLYTGEAAIPPGELRARVADKDALVCLLTDAVDRSVIDAAPKLKVVANVAVGYNNIDVAHAMSRGIVVTNTPDVLTESVADFTWALIFAVTRRLAEGGRLGGRGGCGAASGEGGRPPCCSARNCAGSSSAWLASAASAALWRRVRRRSG